ncbi:MAG TPA: DMT family transporter [Dongiaceae bacterium]|nr:DMT family transporter [Dongiaceae bacterium]
MTAVDTEVRPDRIARGIALILLSTFFTALQDAIFKQASGHVTLWQVYVLRSLFLVPAILAIAFVWGEGAATWRQSLRLWPMLRAALFVLMYFSMYSAIPVLPLSAVAAGIYTAPLFVAALSPLLLGEPVRRRGLLGIAIGFAGVLMILRPGTEAFAWLMLLPVLAGFFYALSAIVTRSKCRSTAPSTLALSLSIALLLTGVLASTALYLWELTPAQVAVSPFLLGSWSWLDLSEWGFIAMLAALMVGNGLVLPAAYQSAPSVIIATFDYTYLIFATVLGIVLFSEVPDIQTVTGIIMIAGAGLIVAR